MSRRQGSASVKGVIVKTISGCAAVFLIASCAPDAKAQAFHGFNLAGAAYHADRLPGRYGYDYVFPKDGEISYYTQKGANIFRLSVLWERVQPQLNGPLDEAYLGRIKHFVEVARRAQATSIIDIHDYGRYRGTPLGTGDVTTAAFADLWSKLGGAFGHDGAVMFGLMNEPQLPSAENWARTQQTAINAIRTAGASNTILISGIKWDSAQHFPEDNGAALAALVDPNKKLLFEVHEYFDSNGSGTKPDCISPDKVTERLEPFTAWLTAHHAHGFLGEFGVARSAACLDDLHKVVDYLAQNTGPWSGWTYWAGGPLWGEYMFTVEPTKSGEDRPQMKVLAPYLR